MRGDSTINELEKCSLPSNSTLKSYCGNVTLVLFLTFYGNLFFSQAIYIPTNAEIEGKMLLRQMM